MEHDDHISKTCKLLSESGLPECIRVAPDAFKAYRRGADFRGLMQILPARWKVSEPVPEIGYKGITVHWEMEKLGYLVLHCEPYDRIGKKKEHDPDTIVTLRNLKSRITKRLREAFAEDPRGCDAFDTDYVRQLTDISGNKVLGFDLGLSESHRPEDAIAPLAELIGYYSPIVDTVIAGILSDLLRHATEARIHA